MIMKKYTSSETAFPENSESEAYRFEIKAYLKSDLAQLYFPCLSAEAALRKLRRWINFNPSLHHELYEGPEGKNDQIFSKRQVAVLVKYLERP
jgi:hypothetical protein